jgi:N-acyl homoserine lactone hydrolase
VALSKQPSCPPIEFPLPGGEPGAHVTVRPLLCARMGMPPNWFHRKHGVLETLRAWGVGVPSSRLREIPIPAYLLEHPRAGKVLVDTGMHETVASKYSLARARNLGVVGTTMSRHTWTRPEQTAAAQLRAIGIDPTDIRLVVMTHLHFDHASALCDFPNANVLVDRREWSGAWSWDSLLHGYSRTQLDARPSYRAIDFNASWATPSKSFERTIDVWGDGALRLVSTPRHTVGHLSLIVRLQDREALLTADAAYTMETIRAGERPWLTHNRKAFEHSLQQIQAYDRENSEAIVIPGHDMNAWTAAYERLTRRPPP